MEKSTQEIEDKIRRILKDVAESSDKIKEYIDIYMRSVILICIIVSIWMMKQFILISLIGQS